MSYTNSLTASCCSIGIIMSLTFASIPEASPIRDKSKYMCLISVVSNETSAVSLLLLLQFITLIKEPLSVS